MIDQPPLTPLNRPPPGQVSGGTVRAAASPGQLRYPGDLGEPDEALDGALPPSDVQIALRDGYFGLQFPPALEARFLADKADDRLRLLRTGVLLSVILSAGMLLPEWMLTPDRFHVAVQLRLLVYAPILGLCAAFLHLLPPAAREWIGLVKSLVAACIVVHLCMSSTDPLAPTYLVGLSMILLFNGGVARIRFWHALRIDLLILGLYGLAAVSVPQSNLPLTVGTTLIMLSTTVSTLYSGYWQEHEERTNWLMQQHEHRLLAELENSNQQLDQLTRFDPLTDVANRRHFDEVLAQVWARATRDGRAVALLMMDIDHFKLYNDRYGHPVGDACLKDVAATMSRHLRRPGDLLARFGGEEFIAVLGDASLDEARTAAERVRLAVWQLQRPHEASPTQDRVTVSIGVACLATGAPGASTIRLLAMADDALYRAKAAGRNQVCAAEVEA